MIIIITNHLSSRCPIGYPGFGIVVATPGTGFAGLYTGFRIVPPGFQMLVQISPKFSSENHQNIVSLDLEGLHS
jgi:hypothetical protein